MWKGKKANAQERKEALSHAQVGMRVGEDEDCEERGEKQTPAGRGSRVRQGLDPATGGGVSELVL